VSIRLHEENLDQAAPFGVLCDEDLVVTRQGPSWSKLGVSLVGRPLLEQLQVVRPVGISSLAQMRTHRGSMLLMRVLPSGPRMRFQMVDVAEPAGLLLIGNPIVSSSEELERLGLSVFDFSPVDQTPDLLFLRRGQERSLDDLRTLNAELQRSATELRDANRMLTRAEAQYRRIVELQPLVMYIDTLGDESMAEFISPQVAEWLGYPVRRWLSEPAFFFRVVVHPEDRDRVWSANRRAEADGSPFDEELRLLTADGHVIWTRAVDSVVEDEDGKRRRFGFMLDVTTAKTAELELRDTMSRLTTLLDHMQSGVLVEDRQRRVVMANAMLTQMFRSDVDPEELTGLPISAAVAKVVRPEDDPVAFLRSSENLTARRWPAVNQSLTLSGSRVLEFDFQPIVSEGQDLGALWMFRDATDRVLYQEALARARDEAIAASDAKSQFLASMSHEIRTPMHGVLATVDLLRTTDLDGEQAEFVAVIDSSASNLVSIINDILDLQKVEAGRIDLVSEPFSVTDTARAVVDLLGPQARAKGIELGLTADQDLPARILGDPVRFRQVLVNLVGNAVKFTTSGSVSLSLRLLSRRGPEAVVEVEVHDTGPGIPPEKVATIFDPFVQARGSQEGTGLGLAIADRLVGLMGGQLAVESVVGSGSMFHFVLHVVEVVGDDEDVPFVVEPLTPAAPTVLVVESSDARRAHVLRLLQRIDVTGVGVGSGQDAVDLLETAPGTRLVLIAARMPDVDGPETTHRIRALRDPLAAKVPVYAMVGGTDDDLLERCRTSGMDGHIGKPVDIGELRRLLDLVLGPGAVR
jgi:PAS domain S-box-containing protein